MLYPILQARRSAPHTLHDIRIERVWHVESELAIKPECSVRSSQSALSSIESPEHPVGEHHTCRTFSASFSGSAGDAAARLLPIAVHRMLPPTSPRVGGRGSRPHIANLSVDAAGRYGHDHSLHGSQLPFRYALFLSHAKVVLHSGVTPDCHGNC